MEVENKKKKGDDVVRCNLYLPREAYEKLEALRKLTGKRSIAETVRAATLLHLALQEELNKGKEIILEGNEGETREKLRVLL